MRIKNKYDIADIRTLQTIKQDIIGAVSTIILLFGLTMPLLDNAMALEKEEQQLLELFKREYSLDREKRQKILTELHQGKIKISNDLKTELIDMFLKESRFQEEYIDMQKKQGVSESKAREKFHQEYEIGKGYKEYYLGFAGLVASFKEIRAIPGLLYGLNLYGGAIVPTHIIRIGESAVEPLLEIAKSKDSNLKSMALFVLSVWVNAPKATEDYSITEEMAIKDTKLLYKLKNFFLKALHDKDERVRSSAVYGLGAFPEISVMRELEEIAKSDPYSFYNKFTNKTEYPIREDAKRSLEKLKAKMKGEGTQ